MRLNVLSSLPVLAVTILMVSCGSRVPGFEVNLTPLPRNAAHHVNTVDTLHRGALADSGWPGAHRDLINSDFVPYPPPDTVVPSWHVLQGKTFWMGPSLDAEGNVYITTAGGPGSSHLHSYDRFGNLRWEAPPMAGMTDLDYKAFVSAPVLGNDDDLYLADADQLRRYRASDGREMWVVDLAALGITRMGFSAFILSDDLVGYAFGDGHVGVFNRRDGSLAVPLLQLPGVSGPPSSPAPPGLFDGLVEPSFIQESWDAIFGLDIELSNTPCVHPETGRIFIIAAGRRSDETVLYGVDLNDEGLTIAFETVIGNTGSGTSPTLGHDGRYVYVTDGRGRLNGVDASTGDIAWKSVETSVTGVSPSTSPDGRVYTSDFNQLKCWDGADGRIIWKADVARDIAVPMVGGLPAKYGSPSADVVSSVLVTDDRLWIVVGITTEIPIPEDRRSDESIPIEGLDPSVYKQPLGFVLASYDLEGHLKGTTPHPDAGAILSMGLDGRIYSTTISITSSIGYAASQEMPFFMRHSPEAVGGLAVYEPESFPAYADKVQRWIADRPQNDAAGQAMGDALPMILAQAALREES